MRNLVLSVCICFTFFVVFSANIVGAQRVQKTFTPKPLAIPNLETTVVATEAAVASPSAEEAVKLEKIKKEDITQPEESEAKKEFITLFSKREVKDLNITNFMAFFVQASVQVGVPANTIILILLLPFLATIVVFVRQIIGLPSLELLVPIALSITLVSTGLTAGVVLLFTIILASIFSRIILKRIRIMQLPKMSISMFVVAIFVLIALTASASVGILSVRQISFFPILLLILLSDKIVALQFSRGFREVFLVIFITLLLGLIGYLILSWEVLRNFIVLYPEWILILIPVNILMGRYFGLRVTEVYRFSELRKYGNK